MSIPENLLGRTARSSPSGPLVRLDQARLRGLLDRSVQLLPTALTDQSGLSDRSRRLVL